MSAQKAVEHWHQVLEKKDPALLSDLIADECVFHSPIVHTPQVGKELTMLYLTGAFHTLAGDAFKYVREIIDGNDALLEFQTEIDGIKVNGVDLIHANADGKITEFKVMVRPLKAINLLHEQMGKMLEQLSTKQAS